VDLPALANLIGECQVVRLTDSAEGRPELGVRFINASVSDRKLLKDFIDSHLAEQQAARTAAVSKASAVK
jgi:hypothetical protein